MTPPKESRGPGRGNGFDGRGWSGVPKVLKENPGTPDEWSSAKTGKPFPRTTIPVQKNSFRGVRAVIEIT
jgi:hypothetical protein